MRSKVFVIIVCGTLFSFLLIAASLPKYVGRFYGDGAGLTNLTGVALLSATSNYFSGNLGIGGSFTVDTMNVGTMTLTNKIIGTNILGPILNSTNQGAVIIDMSKYWSAFNTNAAFAISGFANTDAYLTNVLQHTMIITNTSGSAVKLTWPASVLADLSDSGSYITNQAVVTFVIYPGMGTNAAFKCVK